MKCLYFSQKKIFFLYFLQIWKIIHGMTEWQYTAKTKNISIKTFEIFSFLKNIGHSFPAICWNCNEKTIN